MAPKFGINPVPLDTLPTLNLTDSFCLVLEADVEETIQVPTGASIVFFNTVGLLWISVGDVSISVPSATDKENPCPMFNIPGLAGLTAGDTIRLISDTACTVNTLFYK